MIHMKHICSREFEMNCNFDYGEILSMRIEIVDYFNNYSQNVLKRSSSCSCFSSNRPMRNRDDHPSSNEMDKTDDETPSPPLDKVVLAFIAIHQVELY